MKLEMYYSNAILSKCILNSIVPLEVTEILEIVHAARIEMAEDMYLFDL